MITLPLWALIALLIGLAVAITIIAIDAFSRDTTEEEPSQRQFVVVHSETCFPTMVPIDPETEALVDRLNTLRISVVRRTLSDEISRIEAGNGVALISKMGGSE